MSVKDIVNYLKDPSKKMYLYTFVLVIVFIFVILIILLFSIFGSKKLSYEQMERQMVKIAENYAKDKKMLLKKDTFSKTIKLSTMIENGYMKELKKYNKNYETCDGSVTVTYNGKKFLYTPYFDCGKDYKTKYLGDIIKQSKLNENKDGLYSVDDYYVYKGENPNNYIKFADSLWRIVKVENDRTIKIVQTSHEFDQIFFDDRYNESCPEDIYECQGFNNFETSRLKDKMIEIFNDGIETNNGSFKFSSFEKTIINYQNICVGGVSDNLKLEDGYPECSLKTENKYPFDFIKLNEYIMASLDSNCKTIKDMQCTNYNYMAKNPYYWTATPSDKNTYKVYYISKLPKEMYVYEESQFLFVLNLNKNTLYASGNGTEKKPYVIKNAME